MKLILMTKLCDKGQSFLFHLPEDGHNEIGKLHVLFYVHTVEKSYRKFSHEDTETLNQ
jgi:hypothetical protein